MKFVVGKKEDMTQVFDENGRVLPVTQIRVLPAVVARVKTVEKDGYSAVVVGVEPLTKKTKKGERKTFRKLQEFRVDSSEGVEIGAPVSAGLFVAGDPVKVTGKTIGKGFQGVVKRHGFHGSPKSHGHKDQLRMPGSIGASSFPSHVFKGKRMGGHMGARTKTVRGLRVVEVDVEHNRLSIAGAVPGKRNTLVTIQAQ